MSHYSQEQILAGLRYIWRDRFGFGRPIDADTNVIAALNRSGSTRNSISGTWKRRFPGCLMFEFRAAIGLGFSASE